MNKFVYLALVASASAIKVTPAGNVPANPALTAGAAPGNQPRWGSRYPKIVAPPAPPINWAVPSTKPTRPGPLGSANGDSQSFIAEQFAQVTPAGNVPANPALTAGAAPGNQPRWGSRYPKIVAPPAPPINWAVPSTKPTRPGPLGSANGDSQSFIAVTPDHPVFTADQTAGANADGSVPRFGKAYNLKQEPGVQPGDLAATIPPQVTRWANSHALKQEPGVQPGDLAATIPPQVTRWANSHALKQEPGVQPGDLAATIPPQVTRWANSQGLKQEPGVQPGDLAATIPPQVTRWANSNTFGQVTPDHPEYKPELTAGAQAEEMPRFGSPYRGYNAVQQQAKSLGGVAVRF